ncbi:MAG: hypothetical protein V4508_01645 [Pseudomonadota bacterium]
MTTITSNAPANTAPETPTFSLFGIIETLFAVNMREKLDADTSGDKSDAAYHYGM